MNDKFKVVYLVAFKYFSIKNIKNINLNIDSPYSAVKLVKKFKTENIKIFNRLIEYFSTDYYNNK